MDFNENNDVTPNDVILNYLKVHEQEGEGGVYEPFFLSAQEAVDDILQGLLTKIETRQTLKEEYEFKLTHHNQYPLFKLKDKVADFSIDPQLYEHLTFRETLVVGVFDKNLYEPSPVGALCLDVQKAKGKEPLRRITTELYKDEIYKKIMNQMHYNEDAVIASRADLDKFESDLRDCIEPEYTKFLVHFSSKFHVEGQNSGTAITSWVDLNLHTIEERRSEFIYEGEEKINVKTLYIALQQGNYLIRHTSLLENISDSKLYSMAKMKEYISEGANQVLMRYLAITRYMGTLELTCAYINGDLCRNFYECKGPESGIFNIYKLDVCRIYRTITEECGLVHICVTVLTLQGQIMKQDWKDCNYVWYVNPKVVIKNVTPSGNEKVLLQKDWEKDVQLYSKYLDAKTEKSLKVESYLLDHPELNNVLADYVHQTLLMKPNNILDFTIKYFSTYAPQFFPKVGYLDYYGVMTSNYDFSV